MEKKLSILGVLAILVFIIISLVLEPSVVNNTFVGKIAIGFAVIGGISPWLYLITISKDKVSKKQYFIYFVGSWLLAPYFLYTLQVGKNNAP